MTVNKGLSEVDYQEYLLRLYFGSDQNRLRSCIQRAYRDFNRTLTGIDRLERKTHLYQEAVQYLETALEWVRDNRPNDQRAFDDWHRKVCDELDVLYASFGYSSFSIGQAQKWLNMGFKYIFTFGEQRIHGFEPLYEFCHAPIDNIVIERLTVKGAPGLSRPWSRLSSYEEYLQYQGWIRHYFPDSCPLDTEFHVWMSPPAKAIPTPCTDRRTESPSPTALRVKGPQLGPYTTREILLCSLDASPNSQRSSPYPAAYFFHNASWVGALRNTARSLGCDFTIITTKYGFVEPDEIIAPYDMHYDQFTETVTDTWRRTAHSKLRDKGYKIAILYFGGCSKDGSLRALSQILNDLGISVLTFGRPNMFDINKIDPIIGKLESEGGTSLADIRSVLDYPHYLYFSAAGTVV
jgi:hypothetical protein